MKRLIIIVEGQTEEEFIKSVILPYFQSFGIYDVTPILIATNGNHKGGFSNYDHLKKDVLRRIREANVVVSMFVDYFRMPTNIPQYHCINDNSLSIDQKIQTLEQAIKTDIGFQNFVPYIQKHEFEALLFSNINGFVEYFEEDIVAQIQTIITQYPNPEDINTGAQTAPSKRILNIIQNYEKVVHGNVIAMEIGINNILAKCPNFHTWIQTLITLTK